MNTGKSQGAVGDRQTGDGRWTIVTMVLAALLLTVACVGHRAGARQDRPAATAQALAELS